MSCMFSCGKLTGIRRRETGFLPDAGAGRTHCMCLTYRSCWSERKETSTVERSDRACDIFSPVTTRIVPRVLTIILEDARRSRFHPLRCRDEEVLKERMRPVCPPKRHKLPFVPDHHYKLLPHFRGGRPCTSGSQQARHARGAAGLTAACGGG